VIAFEVNKAGHPNWVFASSAPAPRQGQGAAAPKPAAPAPSATAPRSSSFSELRLNDVSVVDGKISYRDDRTGKVEEVDNVAMKLSLPDLDSPLAGEGSAVWNGQKVSLSLGVTKPRALLNGAKSGLSMRLVAAPVTFGFTGDATGLPPARLTGAVDLAVPSLRDLAKWVGTPMPAGGGLGQLAIKGKLDMQGPKIAFSDAAIALDAITAQGALTVDTGGARPALSGKLQLAKLDLNPYLPPETKEAGAPAAERPGTAAPGSAPAPVRAASAAGWSDAPLDLSALDAADADLDLSAGGIVYRKIEIGPSAFDLHLKNGKLAINLTQLSLYQG
jgi:AsmA protein